MPSDEDRHSNDKPRLALPPLPYAKKGIATRLVARVKGVGGFVNLSGNYNYLEEGYYVSQDFEAEGRVIRPTCKEMLDAYVTPLLLEKSKRADINTANYYITNGYFEPPVIVDTINPFMSRHSIVQKVGHVERVARSLTRNFKYAICCQPLPDEARIGYFRAVLGWCAAARYRLLAQHVWERLRIPLATVRVIILADDSLLLSDLAPLPFYTLNSREKLHVQKQVEEWLT